LDTILTIPNFFPSSEMKSLYGLGRKKP